MRNSKEKIKQIILKSVALTVIFFFFAILTLTTIVKFSIEEDYKYKYVSQTKGKIISSYETEKKRLNFTVYKVEFFDNKGRRYVIENDKHIIEKLSVARDSSGKYQVGEYMPIKYNPKNPSMNSVINLPSQTDEYPLIGAVVSTVLFIIFLICFWLFFFTDKVTLYLIPGYRF